MIAFETSVGQVNGTFPSTQAKNSSTVGGTDGTPLVAAVFNEIWGFHQALMNGASLTPNGSTEVYNASQLLTALQLQFGEPGSLWLSLTQDPVTAGVRALVLTGQVISIASYANLVANTYIGDANNANTAYQYFYKCSDSGGTTRDTAGTYFKLPDFRGLFLRGLDIGGTRNPNGANDFLGNYRIYAMQFHAHNMKWGTQTAQSTMALDSAAGGNTNTLSAGTGASSTSLTLDAQITLASHSAISSDEETRPMQAIVQMGIRY